MNKADLEKKYSSLLKDIDFGRLGLLKRQPNIFFALGVGKYEIRHSNFLAWLLNPKESHGLNDLFLIRFLRDILLDDRCKGISIVDLPDLNLTKTIIHREWNNIDLVINIDNLVIAIENKFLSSEHSNQLKRYKATIDKQFHNEIKIFVYLSPYGEESSEDENYINYSYQNIVDILSDIIELYKTSLSNSTTTYIIDYINALKLLVMESSPMNELALKIYKNHQELLDFIFEVKPDAIRTFDEIIREFVLSKGYQLGTQNKGYVRFLPTPLVDIIPKGHGKGGWTQRESFLFEIVNWSEKKISVKAVIAPNDEAATAILRGVLSKLPGSKKPSGAMWLTYFHTDLPINYKNLPEQDKTQILAKINSEWSKVEEMINKVTEGILEEKDELKKLINSRNTHNV